MQIIATSLEESSSNLVCDDAGRAGTNDHVAFRSIVNRPSAGSRIESESPLQLKV